MPAPKPRERPEAGDDGARGRHFDAPARAVDAMPGQNPDSDRDWYRPPMSDRKPPGDGAPGMKSAYELALERMESQGIERPREDALSDETRERIAAVRRRAEADLAELDILHRDRLARAADPQARRQEIEDHRLERVHIEEQRDRELAKLRGES